jgi:hypothetical protein
MQNRIDNFVERPAEAEEETIRKYMENANEVGNNKRRKRQKLLSGRQV